jgi:L-alanine-DL-glutamate epimerase-like enolase superfamily enzyme
MDMRVEALDLTLRTPFRISRGVQLVAENVLVTLAANGASGIGEAVPDDDFGEQRALVLAALPFLAARLGDDPLLLEDITAEFERVFPQGNAPAKAALDMALYDLVGKQLNLPVYRLLGLTPARTPVSSFTIAIDTPEVMAEKARAATNYPILKIKVGTPRDVEMVRAIRDATNAILRVDANGAWSAKEAIAMINRLAPYDIEFVEQPVAAGDLAGLKLVREHVSVPIIADESCVVPDDVAKVADRVDGINIKLMKCGGLRNALKMIATARAHHLKVMLGCMIESSLSITAAAHLSPLVDYADLDGPLLIEHDPFDGIQYESGKLVLPDRPGLGVVPRDASRH